MKELTKVQTYLFALGALLMMIGTGCVVFRLMVLPATVVFAVGAVLFALMQMQQKYSGTNITIRRLRRTMLIADACFVIAALLMLESNFRFVFPYVATNINGYNMWLHVVYNNWVIALLIGAILEMYTTHRISYELNKEEQ